MSATSVVEGLIKLGAIITDAASKKTDDGKFDFSAFLGGDAPKTIQDAVTSILTALKPDELADAIKDVEKKAKRSA